MKILVTGAAGFIGFYVSQCLLQRGDTVVGIDNLNDYYDPSLKDDRLNILKQHADFTFHKMDLADRSAIETLFKENDCDAVIHLAAQAGVRYSLDNPHAYMDSNIIGHLNVLEGCRHSGSIKRLVYASSSSVYGGNDKKPFSVEDRVDNPVSLYAATKKSNELMSYCYSHLYGIEAVGLRFFTVYGPWGRPDMAYFKFAKMMKEGKAIPIYNNGQMKRDFTYIDDIVAGIVAAIDRDLSFDEGEVKHRVYNLGNNQAETLMDYVETLETALGMTAEKEMLPMQPGDVVETYADITDTQRDLGYKPTTSIKQGLEKFAVWFRDYYSD